MSICSRVALNCVRRSSCLACVREWVDGGYVMGQSWVKVGSYYAVPWSVLTSFASSLSRA